MANEICPIGGNITPCRSDCRLYDKQGNSCSLGKQDNEQLNEFVKSGIVRGITELRVRVEGLEKEVDLLKKKKSTTK